MVRVVDRANLDVPVSVALGALNAYSPGTRAMPLAASS